MGTPHPLKWPGGKSYLARRIVALMPPRCESPNKPGPADPGWLHYVEPYFGGGAVLLEMDPEGISEVANDINGDLAQFWRTLAHPHDFGAFRRLCEATPFSEAVWGDAGRVLGGEDGNDAERLVLRAWAFFVRCRQSLAGRMKSFTGVTKTRTRRGMSNEVSAWLSAVEGLSAVHERLKRVLVLDRPALDVIAQQDGPRTLHYCDPPYLHSTRRTTTEYGAGEMAAEQHAELLRALAAVKGRFLLSGYRSELYDEAAREHGWSRADIEIANHSSGAREKPRMVECLWANYPLGGQP